MELCVSVLELLQWKEDVQEAGELVEPLSQVLRHLLNSTAARPAPAPDTRTKEDPMDTSDEEDSDASSVDTAAPAGAHRYAYFSCYAWQYLELAVLEGIATLKFTYFTA